MKEFTVLFFDLICINFNKKKNKKIEIFEKLFAKHNQTVYTFARCSIKSNACYFSKNDNIRI